MDETRKMATERIEGNESVKGRRGHPAAQPSSPGDRSEAGATPERIIGALFERAGNRVKADNQRTSGRYPWVTKLAVRIIDATGEPRDIVVTTHDLSIGGFSFVYNQFLHNGTIVITRIDALPNHPTITCVVRNCVHMKGAMHRVGVKFERSSTRQGES